VQLVLGRRRVHALHPVRAGDPLLHARPRPERVSGVVVACPASGSRTPRSLRTSLVAWMKSMALPIPA
jgi:hypothetical protein